MKAANDNAAIERKREWHRRYRAKAKKDGLCSSCYKRRKANGKSRCPRCYKRFMARNAPYMRKRRAKAARKGMCATCCARQAQPGLRYCERCSRWRSVAKRNHVGWCDECLTFGTHRSDCREERAA